MRKFEWFLINGLFAFVAYCAFVYENTGAQRVLIFWTWVNTIGLSIVSRKDEGRKQMRALGRSVPRWLDLSYDFAFTAAFIYFGYWITGIAYFLHILLLIYILDVPVIETKSEEKTEPSK